MATRVAGQVPTALQRRPLRVLRPADAGAVYAYPRPEIARLVKEGGLRPLATGYYAISPPDRIGRRWRPQLEGSALGIAAADYGVDNVALMGISAARLYGALPRAVGVAVVAVPKGRPRLRLLDNPATIVFSRRDVGRLDTQRVSTELGQGWMTSIEQTVVDLVARPTLGDLPAEAAEAVHALLPRTDRQRLMQLAAAQRRRTAVVRLLEGEHSAQPR